ncbi:1,5-anhydro-D-fructose reductase [Saccopteryx bilineata]|uniref:1,5-anhydro-D-fructose reductase n=1 Tax=Saccopteryx bilineata TaxID=59482 RepID=UPI00338F3950
MTPIPHSEESDQLLPVQRCVLDCLPAPRGFQTAVEDSNPIMIVFLFCLQILQFLVWPLPIFASFLPANREGEDLMDNPVIQTIRRKHQKSQDLIRFQIQKNVIVIPKSLTLTWILEDFQEGVFLL